MNDHTVRQRGRRVVVEVCELISTLGTGSFEIISQSEVQAKSRSDFEIILEIAANVVLRQVRIQLTGFSSPALCEPPVNIPSRKVA
jgi:hypothetical protein